MKFILNYYSRKEVGFLQQNPIWNQREEIASCLKKINRYTISKAQRCIITVKTLQIFLKKLFTFKEFPRRSN